METERRGGQQKEALSPTDISIPNTRWMNGVWTWKKKQTEEMTLKVFREKIVRSTLSFYLIYIPGIFISSYLSKLGRFDYQFLFQLPFTIFVIFLGVKFDQIQMRRLNSLYPTAKANGAIWCLLPLTGIPLTIYLYFKEFKNEAVPWWLKKTWYSCAIVYVVFLAVPLTLVGETVPK